MVELSQRCAAYRESGWLGEAQPPARRFMAVGLALIAFRLVARRVSTAGERRRERAGRHATNEGPRVHLAKYIPDEPTALVFTGSRGGTPKRGSWRTTVKWTTRVKEAGLPAGFHFHDLRHTGNHLASKSGASTRELMHRMATARCGRP